MASHDFCYGCPACLREGRRAHFGLKVVKIRQIINNLIEIKNLSEIEAKTIRKTIFILEKEIIKIEQEFVETEASIKLKEKQNE